MKGLLYFRLACSGIRKNRKLYFPYLLTVIGMVMMSHIMQSLSYAPALRAMKGGTQLELILSLGKVVIAVFAGIFLLYTNSFLIRRRYREFGLYNVLGMDKNALSCVVLWENLIVALIGLTVGLLLGSLLYKLAELGLVNMIRGQVDYSIIVSPESLGFTLMIFAIIFTLIMVRSQIQVRRARPLELLRSETAGEKPPRANYLLGLLGFALLAGAYYLAVSVSNALSAFTWFFVAVLMVIVGTYLLMISGSVVLCRLLQKWKGYYYQKQHFVSVSSMAYRMKRNGAGLASICILAIMVLVMISSTGSLYIGAEESLSTRYPHDSALTLHLKELEWMQDGNVQQMQTVLDSTLKQQKLTPTARQTYRYATISGVPSGEQVITDPAKLDAVVDFNAARTFYLVPQSDYNRLFGTDISLQPGQALFFPHNCTFSQNALQIGSLHLEIVGQMPEGMKIGDMPVSVVPSVVLVISDVQELSALNAQEDTRGYNMALYNSFDFDGLSDEEIVDVHNRLVASLKTMPHAEDLGYTGECPILERDDFYLTYGGLFFIGIMLSAIFIAAAALIIYYKQVSEGYEDQSRFAIMRKVGMTRRDIKRSINSQILTVFFTPLLMAGIHLCFAFPMVWKLLTMFSLTNRRLAILINVAAFLIFCVFYVIIYKFTAHAYYRIVSGSERE